MCSSLVSRSRVLSLCFLRQVVAAAFVLSLVAAIAPPRFFVVCSSLRQAVSPPPRSLYFSSGYRAATFLSVCSRPCKPPRSLFAAGRVSRRVFCLQPAVQAAALSICSWPCKPPRSLFAAGRASRRVVCLQSAVQAAALSICSWPCKPLRCLVALLVGSGVRLIKPPRWPLVASLSLFTLPWTMVHGKAVRLLHEAQAHNL